MHSDWDKRPPAGPTAPRPQQGSPQVRRISRDRGQDNAARLIGRVLDGQFRIDKPLGSGGMGAIYLGLQLEIERPVVIKVIHPRFTDDKKKLERFRREARSVARLNHPNIVKLFHFGTTPERQLYLAMEYVPGRTLSREIRQSGGLDEKTALHIAGQMARGLGAAHKAGIIHRDLKPANIMLTEHRGDSNYVKILDFGVAKDKAYDNKDVALTRSGARIGTPPYMSPEQVRGKPIDARSDIYAVGLILYELIVGQRAMTGHAHGEVYAKQLSRSPTLPNIRRPDVVISKGTQQLLNRCLMKDREERYPNADALLVAIEEVLATLEGRPAEPANSPPRRSGHPLRLTASVGLVMALAVAAVALTRPTPAGGHAIVANDPPALASYYDGRFAAVLGTESGSPVAPPEGTGATRDHEGEPDQTHTDRDSLTGTTTGDPTRLDQTEVDALLPRGDHESADPSGVQAEVPPPVGLIDELPGDQDSTLEQDLRPPESDELLPVDLNAAENRTRPPEGSGTTASANPLGTPETEVRIAELGTSDEVAEPDADNQNPPGEEAPGHIEGPFNCVLMEGVEFLVAPFSNVHTYASPWDFDTTIAFFESVYGGQADVMVHAYNSSEMRSYSVIPLNRTPEDFSALTVVPGDINPAGGGRPVISISR